MRIVSSAFQDGKSIPTKFAHQGIPGGKNISLPLQWSDSPPDAGSYALSIIDPHPVANNWVHWLVINIPPSCTSLSEGASGRSMPPGVKELRNSYGETGYGGPQPPRGTGPHPYEVTVYALSEGTLELSENTTIGAFLRAIESKILASAKTTGIFERT